MLKLADWETRLAQWATGELGKPFAWGVRDCATLAFDAVLAMTGEDPGALHRGKYEDEKSALRYQRTALVDLRLALERAGLLPVQPGFQQRGDILIVERGGFQCGHVCFGTRCLDVWPEHGVAWCFTRDVLKHAPLALRAPGG